MHVHICAACTCVCLTSEQEAVMSSLMYEGEVGTTEVSPNTCIKGMTLGKEDADADTGALASPCHTSNGSPTITTDAIHSRHW